MPATMHVYFYTGLLNQVSGNLVSSHESFEAYQINPLVNMQKFKI